MSGREGWVPLTTVEELEQVVGTPTAAARDKVRDRLHALDRAWLQASPFCLVATADAEGRCDVSPKGDPGGLVHVLDERTVVVPERPGNRRVDGFRNVLANPQVGLLSLLPGRGDCLRLNGRATVLRDAPFFDDLVVQGHRPLLALVVEVEEVFSHCAKALLRSALWDPSTWDPEAVPARAVIAKTLERPHDDLQQLQEYYGPSYAATLYG